MNENENKTKKSLKQPLPDSSEQEAIKKETKPSAWKKFWKAFVGFWTSKSTKEMLSYIGKRLILLVFTFIVIFLICFVLVRLLPVAVDSGMKDPEIFYRQMVAQGRYVQNSDGSYSPMPVLQQLCPEL